MLDLAVLGRVSKVQVTRTDKHKMGDQEVLDHCMADSQNTPKRSACRRRGVHKALVTCTGTSARFHKDSVTMYRILGHRLSELDRTVPGNCASQSRHHSGWRT